jgi:leucyl aminopeptidase
MPFETALAQAQVAGYETPLLAIALGRSKLPQSLDALDKGTGRALDRVLSSGDFVGKKDEVAVVYPTGPAARVLLVGLGKVEEIDSAIIRRAAAIAAKRARSIGVPRAAFHLPAESRGKVPPEEAAQAIAEGLAQGAWQYNEMKRRDEDSKKPELERVDILLPD